MDEERALAAAMARDWEDGGIYLAVKGSDTARIHSPARFLDAVSVICEGKLSRDPFVV